MSCEASYGTTSLTSPFNPGVAEKVDVVAITNPYKVYVGVAGAQKVAAGDFELRVTLKPR